MINSHINIKDIFILLEGIDYAILRNQKKIISDQKITGDIDLIIKKKDLKIFKNALINNLQLNIKIFEILNHGIRLIIFKENPWFFLKLDVHFYESYKGIEIFSAKDLIDNSQNYMFLNVVSDLDEAMIHAFRLFQWGKIKDKDYKLVKKIHETKNIEFRKKLKKYFGKSFLKYLKNTIYHDQSPRLNLFQKIPIILYLLKRNKFKDFLKIARHYFLTFNNFIYKDLIEDEVAKGAFDISKPALEVFLKSKFPGITFNIQNKQLKTNIYSFEYRFYDINIFLCPVLSSDLTIKEVIRKLDDRLINHLQNLKDF